MRRRITRLLVTAVVAVAGLSVAFFGSWYLVSLRSFPSLEPYHEKYGLETLLKDLETEKSNPGPFSFVVLGDSRSNMLAAKKVMGAVAAENADLIFNTGDLIRSGTPEQYLEHHIPLLKIVEPAPMFCVPGNHDRGAYRDYAAYDALYGGDRFSFDYGSCRFVGFNASETVRVSGSDLRFLDRELGKPGADYKFVFFHIPPKYFESQIVDDARRGFEWNADKLRELLTRHKVTEVFMGHIHGYAAKVIDNVRYTLTAGGGATFSDRLPAEGRVYHFVVIHVGPEGLRREVVYLSGDEWLRKAAP